MAADIEYLNRLERVKAGVIGCNRTIYVGLDEAYYMAASGKIKKDSRPVAESLSNLLYTLSFVWALLLGLGSEAIGRYFRFIVLTDLKVDAPTDMLLNGGLGLMVGLFTTQMFRLKSNDYRVLQAIGVFVGVCTFHNWVHWYPALFDAVFSPIWVADVTNSTKPNSILFRGISFVLSN